MPNIVIANTSSAEAPANIRDGIPLSVPNFSIYSSIGGTITAGDTAAIINPRIPPSINVKPNSFTEINAIVKPSNIPGIAA